MNKYKIYHWEKNKAVTDSEFEAKDRHSAYSVYRKWCLKNDDKEYFYREIHITYTINKDGSTTPREMDFLEPRRKKNKYGEYTKGYICGKKDKEREINDSVVSFLKSGHGKDEWYSIYSHILSDLEYNLPILIKKHSGYPTFIQDIVKDKLKCEDVEKIDKESSREWENMLNGLLEDVKLYRFYENFGIIDDDETKDNIEFFIKYKSSIPYYPGTETEIDYNKLHRLTKKHWDRIWDFMKKYGQSLWD